MGDEPWSDMCPEIVSRSWGVDSQWGLAGVWGASLSGRNPGRTCCGAPTRRSGVGAGGSETIGRAHVSLHSRLRVILTSKIPSVFRRAEHTQRYSSLSKFLLLQTGGTQSSPVCPAPGPVRLLSSVPRVLSPWGTPPLPGILFPSQSGLGGTCC